MDFHILFAGIAKISHEQDDLQILTLLPDMNAPVFFLEPSKSALSIRPVESVQQKQASANKESVGEFTDIQGALVEQGKSGSSQDAIMALAGTSPKPTESTLEVERGNDRGRIYDAVIDLIGCR